MKAITIVNRALTLKESNQVNLGFDTLMREEHVALEETEPIHFVAIQEDNLIGCAIGLAHKNGDVFSGWFHFTDLFVEKEFRNLGIGASLLKELEAHCKANGVTKIWLWTSGAASVRFYKRHEYSQFAELEHWYSDGSSRIGLRKTI
ncbi:GNAT family N-acetyltransferase [Croceibacter atlanticus]|uniref:GNAT family N-acetyltransferase n=1 Tax=Croceibacter atlanticus TaxID=313588 RepID=UPI002E1035C1|nr:GNAT family N-acetyltransferase [Croceibacter atlanticus]